MKKLTCHCGGVEAEVKLPEKGLDRIDMNSVEFVRIRDSELHKSTLISVDFCNMAYT